jgi:hypothetical protein
MGAAGAASAAKTYIEDVFSTWLYTGNNSTQTITNGIDLSGKGGLVWIKNRDLGVPHRLFDTVRGYNKSLSTDATSAQATTTTDFTSFNSDGFTLGVEATVNINSDTRKYASWTFREQAKFFDVVTWTGNGSNRTIAHNLGSVPGCIIVKRTDTTGDWQVYHRSLANTEYMVLNSTAAKATGTTRWNSTTPTSTVFSLGTDATVNASGGTYVAYLFAHDAGGFGDSGNDSVVKCGSYTGNGSTNEINLGWEPQWLLIKRSSGSAEWAIIDNMRGIINPSVSPWMPVLAANSSNTESFFTSSSNKAQLNPTGFTLTAAGFDTNYSGETYIYIAIRRGPMKTPTDATKVFEVVARTGTGSATTAGSSVLTDVAVNKRRDGAGGAAWNARMTGVNYLDSSSTDQEFSSSVAWDTMVGIKYTGSGFNGSSLTYVNWNFRRAPGYFDAVCYTGTGSARTVSHNLGVAPELMIVRRRDVGNDWTVYSAATGATNFLLFGTDASQASSTRWNNTAPTSSVFTVGTANSVNVSSGTYIAYLFASCPGVSKCFSFTGNGTSQTINCGFTAGAKFVLIKRTDSTGNWLVADTARGIVSGNDPLLYLNSTAAEVTTLDWIDPDNSGFVVNQEATANANVNGATYIGLAIA